MGKILDVYFQFAAGGTITWERFACGLPGIVFSVAENQVKMARDLSSHGFQFYAGPIESYSWTGLEKLIKELKNNKVRNQFIQKGREVVDGHGVDRIMDSWLPTF
jgi:spore coat polysaccharide biosynthesis predicted glycosyltransferase SpsG